MNGVLVVDKPADYTSFDVVAVVRRLAGREKTGHTGTLDPMATGVLPILLGKATRAASLLEDTSKEYRAEFAFGYATDTQDSTGEVLARSGTRTTEAALLASLSLFRGNILQEPPMYSAVRKDGKRLYELARQGITVERKNARSRLKRWNASALTKPPRPARWRCAVPKGPISAPCARTLPLRSAHTA